MHRHRHVTAGALQVLAWNGCFQAMYAKDQLGQNRNRGSKVDVFLQKQRDGAKMRVRK